MVRDKINGSEMKNTPVQEGVIPLEMDQINNSDYKAEQFDYSSTSKKKKGKSVLNKGYGILPNIILFDREITDGAKLLFVYISSLCALEGYCWASNKHLADKTGCSIRKISRQIKELEPYLIIKDGKNQQRTMMLRNTDTPRQKWQGSLDKNVQHNITSGIKKKTKKETADAVEFTGNAAPNGRQTRIAFFGKNGRSNKKDKDLKKDYIPVQPTAATGQLRNGTGYKTLEELGLNEDRREAVDYDKYRAYFARRPLEHGDLED